jgi:autotransporter-associated beta strand protein
VTTADGGVNWSTSSGGFAASGGTLTLNLNGDTSSLTWNGSSMVQTGQTLIFGSTSADSLVDFQNDLNLGSSGTNTRTISVIDNPGSSTDIARISGDLTNTAAGQGIIKTGDGTLELTGTNSYTGATAVSEGTLALIGGSQTSAITVEDGASLGFTLGSPTTSTASVDLTDGTVKITGTVDNSSDYQLMTASSFIGGTPSLAPGITDYALELQNSGTELWLVYTGSGGSPFETWADGTFANGTLTDKTPGGDEEGDGLTNLREFAFGTDPTVNFTGVLEYVNGGAVTTPGQPVLLEDGGTYYAVFGRRTTYVTDGLTYNVQFSADLSSPWVTSGATPTILATSGGIEAVSVPFPGLIITDSGPQKARFFRVVVSLAP